LLSARGMPQVMMERHLELLREELAAAVPDRGAGYDKLLAAAQMLRAQRRPLMSDDALRTFGAELDAAVGPEWSARIGRMGELLASAAVDERLGVGQAVISIESWAADPERFPEPWIAAVRDTIARAREHVAR
ncbi:MAG TPA: hypothetical protein VGG20_18450, partial [Thermoanaerobaculia bacterium]